MATGVTKHCTNYVIKCLPETLKHVLDNNIYICLICFLVYAFIQLIYC